MAPIDISKHCKGKENKKTKKLQTHAAVIQPCSDAAPRRLLLSLASSLLSSGGSGRRHKDTKVHAVARQTEAAAAVAELVSAAAVSADPVAT